MVNILNEDGEVIHTSGDLRAIVDHNRRACVELCYIVELLPEHDAILAVVWMNGDSCITHFNSFTVAQQWAKRNHGIKAANNTVIWEA